MATDYNPRALPSSPITLPKRRQIPAADWSHCVSDSQRLADCLVNNSTVQVQIVDVSELANDTPQTIAANLTSSIVNGAILKTPHDVHTATLNNLSGCLNNANSSMVQLEPNVMTQYGQVHAQINCAHTVLPSTRPLNQCNKPEYTAAQFFNHCANNQQSGIHSLSGCLKGDYLRAVPPPCEWYPIKLPDKPKPQTGRVCGKLPQSNRLPLTFTRRRLERDSRQLPLPFTCNDDFVAIPALDSYMILHNITASADGKPLELLSANLSADTSGYYWSGDFTLPPDDFARLNLDTRKDDCFIELNLNGELFIILAESYRDNRQFGQRSYTITGRSRTAKLGADYAVSHKGLVNQDRNARQIADEAIAMLGVELDWQIDDWLVPANVYSLTDKTPMAVLADIAQAAGAFVESHPNEAKISIKPRWRVAAWELNSASAAVSVPDNVIIGISGQKQVNTQAHGVFVWGAHDKGFAADVWRDGSNREPRAATQTHPLYTAQEVCRMAGIAALSATGIHKSETVQLPLAPKYGLNRAELGRVWRFNEANGAWQGIVTGIDISIERDNDAIKVMQSVSVDRYLGD